jgi:hypothetical protein
LISLRLQKIQSLPSMPEKFIITKQQSKCKVEQPKCNYNKPND